jgi:hypothetical protein
MRFAKVMGFLSRAMAGALIVNESEFLTIK